ncbi:hypothetical protein [Nocardioides sp. T2.26MG-1]|uniref:hypothetical protein n=1 Tax=Nocardioides sp. T2.26MG-1 TaxID=3041166 RepID=UPI0024778252|nr:hypothetical protein [Nocardioides sp. T2.26MG-1]CAI9417197.1 hypothetical protein HIDPHFAB_02960 [Nocardioides sp. T2.26MG-1]
MSYDYDWCGHTADEPDARPCGAPIERWSSEWKHRKYELDADHKAVPQAPVGPLDEALFLRADRYASVLAASVVADERIAALTELVRQHEYYRSQAESQLRMVQEDPQYGTVWDQTGPEPDEDDVHAVLCLTTGAVYRRNKWSGDWQKAHHDPHAATHYQWPIPDAGPFIAWRDGYEFDRVIKDAQAHATEFDALHRKLYGEAGYRSEDGSPWGRPNLAEAIDRILLARSRRTSAANEKAQRATQALALLRRAIGYLQPDDTQWPASDGSDEVRDVEVIDLQRVRALLDNPSHGGAA